MNYNKVDLTFFAWSDAHLGYAQCSGADDIRAAAIEQMKLLPGRLYPEDVGGIVDSPGFIIHCGDIVDGEKEPSGEIKFAYFQNLISVLDIPHYEVLGNHEITGNNRQFMEYFLKRYGAKSYAFTNGNIGFIALAGEYDEFERGHIPDSEMDFLEKSLMSYKDKAPAVLLLHSPLNELQNSNAVIRILRGNKIILSIAGHKHRPGIFEIEGIPCINIGHCRNHPCDTEFGRSFYVIRIRGAEITAVPWRWDKKDWERGEGWSNPKDIAEQLRLTAKWSF